VSQAVPQHVAAETILGHASIAPAATMPMSTRFMMSSLYRVAAAMRP
jgi:hypothetical protein